MQCILYTNAAESYSGFLSFTIRISNQLTYSIGSDLNETKAIDILNFTQTQPQTPTPAYILLADLTLKSFSDDIELRRNNSAVHSCPC